MIHQSTQVLANDIFTTAGDDYSSAHTGFLYGNKRMGPMRIRQVWERDPGRDPIALLKFLVTYALAHVGRKHALARASRQRGLRVQSLGIAFANVDGPRQTQKARAFCNPITSRDSRIWSPGPRVKELIVLILFCRS